MATPMPMPERQPELPGPRFEINQIPPDLMEALAPRFRRRNSMGEATAGQLLMFAAKGDRAAANILSDIEKGDLRGVQTEATLPSALARAGMEVNPALTFGLYLLAVPEGAEEEIGDVLERRYTREGGAKQTAEGPDSLRFAALPNPVFRLAGHPTVAYYQAKHFQFKNVHEQYKAMLGLPAAGPAASQRPGIAILDSGVAQDVPFDVAERRSFVDETDPRGLDDFHHGTAVAMIINDVYPQAEIRSFKVLDSEGYANGMDVLAPLCGNLQAHIINLSLAYRPNRTSLVTVMRRLISELSSLPTKPIVLAAAGNDAQDNYSTPACLPEVVAVTSINGRRELSSFSCHGGKDVYGQRHERVFALPGGENRDADFESIGNVSGPKQWELWGTSFATAYASGLIAATWSRLGLTASHDDVFDAVIANADRGLNGYTYEKYGHGLPVWT